MLAVPSFHDEPPTGVMSDRKGTGRRAGVRYDLERRVCRERLARRGFLTDDGPVRLRVVDDGFLDHADPELGEQLGRLPNRHAHDVGHVLDRLGDDEGHLALDLLAGCGILLDDGPVGFGARLPLHLNVVLVDTEIHETGLRLGEPKGRDGHHLR